MLALQFWEGDQYQAEDLVRIICDLETEQRGDAEFALCPRRGSDMSLVADMERALKRKFNRVHILPGHGFATGWPHAPNELWAETMMAVSMLKRSGKTTCNAVLTFEPDCVPLAANWITALRTAWGEAVNDGARCMGSLCPKPVEHINGNLVIEIGLHNEFPELRGSSPTQGWDVEHARLLTSVGVETKLIGQRYQQPVITEAELKEDLEAGVALLHGVKDKNLMRVARKFLGL